MAFTSSGVWVRPILHRKRQIAVRNYLAESKPEELDADVALQVNDLSLAWSSGRPVLKGISFSVPKGQVCMVVGPNGCGKSTLLRLLHGLTYADSGKINIRSPVGFVFQDPSVQMLFPTVFMEVMSGTDEDAPMEERVELATNALKRTGMMHLANKPTLNLSGGQKQRIATATMLVRRPQFMLFDEVTASLDPEARVQMLEFAIGIVKELNIGSLWVTHVYDELECADRVIVLDSGAIIADGSLEEVKPTLSDLWARNEGDW
ncbi:hypothetical protein NDN08_001668 [Rhodosorus marinus]|uniref:Probable ATP-dependent transporter ycf16 n=1 Tax=Rhodosorus marinus TaxID=101924 RepID=A0AAV8UU95_9RHOD|nr:hypothetical protein NDN08_001668 [Rhodosorus marinus]